MQDKKNIVARYIPAMFKNVRPGWKKILLSKELRPILSKCFGELNTYLKNRGVSKYHIEHNGLHTYIRPAEGHIFEAMKYFDPQNLRVIIMGQDPYLKPDEAHGLSFSVPKSVKISPSLRNIYSALYAQGLLSEMPHHGNLVGWAKQGVLLLNRYLTRSPNIVCNDGNVHIEGNGDASGIHEFWGELTSALLRYLTGEFMKTRLNHDQHTLHIFLWGTHACSLASEINTKVGDGKHVIIHEWGHPSPMNRANSSDNPGNFKYCDHFRKVPEINWDPDYIPPGDASLLDQFYILRKSGGDIAAWCAANKSILYDDGTSSEENVKVKSLIATPAPREVNPVVVSIDGGCTGNGKATAEASYGVYFPESYRGKANPSELAGLKLSGLVPENLIKLVDGELHLIKETTKKTNNRGELLAAIHALQKIIRVLKEIGPRPVVIIGDSTYVLELIKSRLWGYLNADPSLGMVKKNHDLVTIISQLLHTLSELVPNKSKPEFKNKSPRDVLITTTGGGSGGLSWGGLTVIHTNSHLKEKGMAIPETGTAEHEHYLYNQQADDLCNLALGGK